jgi:hypothetical protein
MSNRRFPPPWSIEEGSACFIVRDHDKQALAYVYPAVRCPPKEICPPNSIAIYLGHFFSGM